MTDQRRFTEVKPLDPENVWGLDDDHPAVVEGRSLFPTRTRESLFQTRLLIEGKNSRKIGNRVTKGPWKGMPIFTLTLEERATCPRSCVQWKTCYGNAMQFARRHTAGIELENLLGLEVRDLLKEHGKIAVRLHVLGDFYSKQYVESWQHLMRKHEGLHVFGFTARRRGDEIGRGIHAMNLLYPERFVIRWSCAAGEMGAHVLSHVPEGPKVGASFVCPAQTGKTGCCATCGLCWSEAMKDQAVAFVLHGGTRKRAKRVRRQHVTNKRPGRKPKTKPESKKPGSAITLVRSVRTRETFEHTSGEARL